MADPTSSNPGSRLKDERASVTKLENSAELMRSAGQHLKMLQYLEKALEARCEVSEWVHTEALPDPDPNHSGPHL